MARTHRERALHDRIEHQLGASMPKVDLLDVELDGPRETLRVFIDHPEGVDLELCADVTHAIRDECPELALEVSSPGEERPLRRREHFAAAAGSRVRLRRDGARRAAMVEVVEADDDAVTFVDGEGQRETVPYDEIVRCRLAPPPKAGAAQQQRGRTKRKGRTP